MTSRVLKSIHGKHVEMERLENKFSNDFFFIQMADTQLGIFEDNLNWDIDLECLDNAILAINRLKPKFVITCGDLTNAYPDLFYDQYLLQIADLKERFDRVDPEIPLVCVCGNHDVSNRPTVETLSSYRDHFGDDYFSFLVEGCYCIVFNSMMKICPDLVPDQFDNQESWLDDQLLKAQSHEDVKHIFLFMHHPVMLKDFDEETDYYSEECTFNFPKEIRTDFVEKLERANVRAVFSGHYHRNAYVRHHDIEYITTSAVGLQVGDDSSGFRIVKVREDGIEHQYYPFDNMIDHVELVN